MQQAHAATGLQPRQGARDLAHRHLAFARRGRQGAELGDAGEEGDVVQLELHGRSVRLFCEFCKTIFDFLPFPGRACITRVQAMFTPRSTS